MEKTPEEYVANMVALFREVRRVLKADGVLWLNLGDSYAATRWSNTPGTGFQGEGSASNVRIIKETNLKSKDLVGIPWRVAFALQADGWYLRQDIIWHKPNPMPESVRDRCTKSHEYIFMLTKSAKYYFDSDAIQETARSKGRTNNTTQQHYEYAMHNIFTVKDNRNKRSVWTVATKPYKEAHFATYPPDLILPCILTSKPNAVILDPFFGSGTTGLVAVQNGRKYIGIDLNKDYCEIAVNRISKELEQTRIEL